MQRLDFTCLKPECGYDWQEWHHPGTPLEVDECPACRAGSIEAYEEMLADRAEYARQENRVKQDYYGEKYGD